MSLELVANSPTPGTVAPLCLLSAPITTAPAAGTVESWAVSAAAPAALRSASGQFRVIIDAEVMIVAASASGASPWSFTRGAEGTTPTTHLTATPIFHYLTAGALLALTTRGLSTGPGSVAGALTGSAQTIPAPVGWWGVLNQALVTVTLPAPALGAAFLGRFDQDSVGGRQLAFASVPAVNDPTGVLNIQGGVALGIVSTAFGVNLIRFVSDGLAWYAVPDTAGPPTADQADQARYSLAVPTLRPTQAVLTSGAQALTGTPVIDGYQTVAGDRILRAVIPADASNGPWVIAAGAWSRPSDYPTGGVITARSVLVAGGNTAANKTLWISLTTTSITIDTGASTWTTLPSPVPVATPSVQGTVQLTVTAANPAAPVAVGDNDFRMTSAAPYGSKAGRMQSISRAGILTAGITPSTGTMIMTFATARETATFSKLEWLLAVASAVGADAAAVGLYTLTNPDASNVSATLVARSALTTNSPAWTSILGGSTGTIQFAMSTAGGFPASYQVTQGTRYGLGLLLVFTGTPKVGGVTAVKPSDFDPFLAAQAGTALADLPNAVNANGGAAPAFSLNVQSNLFWTAAST